VIAVLDSGADLHVGRVRDQADYLQLERLYRAAFGIRDDDGSINARLLMAMDHNSGIVVVAYAGSQALGFACSFLSRDPSSGRMYQYSQTAAVAPEAQGRGIGRLLKQAQRREALTGGVDLMRWVFDPMRARNAHVNLDVLGGEVRTLHRNFYGAATHGRDDGDRSDRFVLDWELAREVGDLPAPVHGVLPPFGEGTRQDDIVHVPVPADWDRARADLGLDRAIALRATTTDRLAEALEAGLVAVSCRRVDPATAYYTFVPEPARWKEV
jgi:predicted GNAT superfamily acetyltransferase